MYFFKNGVRMKYSFIDMKKYIVINPAVTAIIGDSC